MSHATHNHFPKKKHIKDQHGQIQVIFGPMFSGKTTELLRRMKRYRVAKYKCLLVKYAKDTRYDELGVATHDRQVAEAISCTSLDDVENKIYNYDVVGIDEGQFFGDVVKFSESLANRGKTVIVAALDGDFQRKGFGSILDLVPLAESVVKLSAVCMICFEEGSFTKRLGSEKAIEVIGGADKYMAACRSCHLKKVTLPADNQKENEKQNTEVKKVLKQKRNALEPLDNYPAKMVKSIR
eukprot:gene9277-10255_t